MKAQRKITLGLLLAFAALAVAVGAAWADGTITVNEGVLSAADTDIDFGSVPFDFVDQFANATPNPWSISDTKGDGLGWHVDAVASDFTNGSDSIAVTTANQRFRITIPGGTIVCTAGDCPADTGVDTGVPGFAYLDPTTPVRTIFCDPAAGADGCPPGAWEYGPSFRLTVPGGTLPSTYTSTVTTTVSSGP